MSTFAIHQTKKNISEGFAESYGFYEIFLLFVIGAFLGDMIETIYMRIVVGEWMSRSSLVWGDFSVVWGLALALGTLLLCRFSSRSGVTLFLLGAFLGGVYEYLCSVFTELSFGKVFWDYSRIPLNLGGRVNLLYCFFWGAAALIWLRKLYPLVSQWIRKIPLMPGKLILRCLVLFMAANMVVSALALVRSAARDAGEPAGAPWEQWIDRYYGDEVIRRIYPSSISTLE